MAINLDEANDHHEEYILYCTSRRTACHSWVGRLRRAMTAFLNLCKLTRNSYEYWSKQANNQIEHIHFERQE